MNKSQLIDRIAEEAGINKTEAGKALGAMLDAVTDTLKDGGKVSLIGFGTFSVQERAAREGHNPATGKKIKIAAKKVPKFKAGAELKRIVED